MYLTDLAFIEEGTPNYTEDGLVNFSKMRMISHIIREIRQFQQTAYKIEHQAKGGCGSCWTFSTTGALESAVAIATGKLLSLAEQQLVDCAQNFNNHGCQGGLPSQAFEYIRYNRGIMGEDTYPYKGKDDDCKFQPSKAIAFVKDVVNITMNDEASMVEAVGLHNPVSFAFEVTNDFLLYRKGIYSRYFLIERGKNMCGLAACASYPIPLV
ncbi:pro-cathepsin H-like protein [Camelus ferus]|nr:pro-cathepsin H-like protein [Camelus ferus]